MKMCANVLMPRPKAVTNDTKAKENTPSSDILNYFLQKHEDYRT